MAEAALLRQRGTQLRETCASCVTGQSFFKT